ncbi:RNA polymerase sigma-70 factor [Chitinophagales bacterium]|nr:RNA polymerase sigma-70 factor [Chitinophagales bacterium]
MGSEKEQYLEKIQFEQLFKSLFPSLCSYVQQFIADKDASQEICQQVFIRLWEKREQIDPTQNIKAYLFRAVKNKSLNYIRDHKKFRSQILDLDCLELEFTSENDQNEIDDLKQSIEKSLQKLPSKCREVFELSKFHQLKYREIAEELDISPKTVEAHMSKALKALREDLGRFWFLFLLIYSASLYAKANASERSPQSVVESAFAEKMRENTGLSGRKEKTEHKNGATLRVNSNSSVLRMYDSFTEKT